MEAHVPKRVAITGATGTIGAALTKALVARGDQPIVLTRSVEGAQQKLGDGIEAHEWAEPTAVVPPAAALAGADAVINLLGEPIAQRWNEEAKQRIHDSRVLSTRNLVTAMRALGEPERPGVLVSQSATGYYGPSDDRELDESAPAGDDFLAGVVVAWEAEAQLAADFTRVALTRTGVVLSPSGGALEKMLPFFRLGVGGPVAGGKQYVPWIHVDDVVDGLLFCVDTESASGPVNMTAPNPVDNSEFSKALGHALHRPAVLPVPAFAIKLLYGEMAVIVTTGQRVNPHLLLELGYGFRHPTVGRALVEVLGG